MSRRGMRRIVAVMLFLAGTVGDLWSAGRTGWRPGQPLRLTLKQAVQLALKQNPQVLVARLLTMESGQQQQIARAGLLPQANLTAATALEQYNFQSIERFPKPMAAGPYQWIEAGPTFSQSVLNLPLIRNYQIGREGVRESRAQERSDARGYYGFGGPAIPPGVAGDCDPGRGEGTGGSGGAAFKSGHQSATKPRRSQRGNRERMLSGGECCPQVCSC